MEYFLHAVALLACAAHLADERFARPDAGAEGVAHNCNDIPLASGVSLSYSLTMEIDYTVQVWREGSQFVAHAMPLDVASGGPTPVEARTALDEAVKLFLKTARDHGTLAEVLEDAGYLSKAGQWQSPDWVGVEKHSALIAA